MNTRSIIIIALCLLFFLIWYPLMERLGWLPDKEPPASVQEEVTPSSRPDSSKETEPETLTDSDRAAVPNSASSRRVSGGAALDISERPAPSATKTLALEEYLTASLAADRGGITEVSLRQFMTYGSDNQVTLGHYRFPYCSLFSRTGKINLAAGQVVMHSPHHASLTREATDLPLSVTEHWQLDPEQPYRLEYAIEFTNNGDEAVGLDDLAVAFGGLTAENLGGASKLSRVGRVDLAAEVKTAGDKRPESFAVDAVEDISSSELQDLSRQESQWIAVHNKYFLFYLSESERDFSGCILKTAQEDMAMAEDAVDRGDEKKQWLYGSAYLKPLTLKGGESVTLDFDGYAGPKEYKRLRSIEKSLVSIMRLDLFMFFRAGWMGIISTTILKSLIWIKGLIGYEWGYGVAIIIITVIIKTLFWPLTHKSTVSMRRMQKLQPLMKELREKYKDDAQKMNRKLMELYKEHKVNPVGGCLPILCQIPVFFALFNTLRGAIELRQASFLWVGDLSLPDTLPWDIMGFPIRPLAILMGGTMFLQQQLAPSTGDPSQKRMMTFMTVFFMFIFYSMPAGLTLYWTTNQILTIFQNSMIKHFESDGDEKE